MKRGIWLVVVLLLVVSVFARPVDWSLFESKFGDDAWGDGGQCYMEWKECGTICVDPKTVRRGLRPCTEFGTVLTLPASKFFNLSVNVSNAHFGFSSSSVGAGLFIGAGSVEVGSIANVSCVDDAAAWGVRSMGSFFSPTPELAILSNARSGVGNIVRICGGGESKYDRGNYSITWNKKRVVTGVTLEDGLKQIGSLSNPAFFNRSLSPDDVSSQGTKVSVVDFDSKVIVKFDTENTVSDFASDILACVNYDGDDTCDYEENSCDSLSQFYNGLCCGSGDFASSKYYAANDIRIPDAYCGKTEGGLYRWATQNHIAEVLDYRSDSVLNRSVVSDGSKRYVCGATIYNSQTEQLLSSPVNIANHGFLCGDDRAIYECVSYASDVASGSPYAPRNNAVYPGSSVKSGGADYYCSRTGSWASDLDASPFACVDAGFVWAGTACCGEPVDSGTSQATFEGSSSSYALYSDITRIGGCLNNSFVPAGSILDSGKIINHVGKFYSCGESSLFSGTPVTPTSSAVCGVPLIGVSLNLTPNAVCSPLVGWSFTKESASTIVKDLVWESSLPASGCCPVDTCWDGSSCKRVGEYFDVGRRGFRCEAE